MKLVVNGLEYETDVEPEMPLLWVLRDELGVAGPKYGCGVAQCGACTIHLDGAAVRSCVVKAKYAQNREITTIEGLAAGGSLHAVQQAWTEQQVAQCGYCQFGQMMQAAAFLDRNFNPTDDEIDAAMSGNLCRCGTYPRIKAAIKSAVLKLNDEE